MKLMGIDPGLGLARGTVPTVEDGTSAPLETKRAPVRADADRAALLELAEALGAYCADLVLSGKIPLPGASVPTTGETTGLLADKSA